MLKSHLDYWQQQLSDNIPALELPIDRPRPTVPTYQGTSQSLVLSEHLTEALKALSHQEGVSLFVTLLAAFKTLLYRYTGQEDILICSPVAGRNRVEIKKLIGYFNNLVVMRTDLSGNPSFRDLVGRVSRVTLGSYEHQDLPFQKLAELPTLVRMPLSRAMFVLQNTPSQPLELAGIAMIPLDLDWETTNFDLSISMYEKGKQLAGVLQYKTALFDTTTITQMLEHFQSLLDSLVTNPDQHLKDLPLLTEAKPHQLFDKTRVPVPSLLAPTQIKQELEETFVASRDELELQLTKIWEKVLGIKPIGVRDNFFELGGHSLLALQLFAEIEKTFNTNLPLAALFQAPTVEQLASILRQSGWSSPWFSLVPIQPGGSKPPLFGIHVLGQGFNHYRSLARYLGSEQPIYGLHYGLAAQTIDKKQISLRGIEELAANYIKEMQTLQPEGPYFLVGNSAGGLVAFEMAQQLHAQSQKVGLLAFIDTYGPNYVDPVSITGFKREALELKLKIEANLSNFLLLEPGELLPYTLRKLKSFINWHFNMKKDPFLQKMAEIVASSVNQKSYVPQVYPGRITLFRCNKRIPGYYYDPELGWGGLAAEGIEIYEISGSHHTIMDEPGIRFFVEKFKPCLDKALMSD